MSIDKLIEDAKAWLESDEGKAALIFAMKEVELSNFELMKASKVKTEYLHEPFVPMLAKFAQLQSARQGEPVNDALEKAAKICDEQATKWAQVPHGSILITEFTITAKAIRALINTSPPSTQEATLQENNNGTSI